MTTQMFKKNLFAAMLLSLLTSNNAFAVNKIDFETPPDSAKPRLWWHWMAGNVTKDGIEKDLAWMHRVGIGGLQNFDAELYAPRIIEPRVNYMSPEWAKLFGYAVDTATNYGMEFGIAASPGWSETGGPWVQPKDGMKKLVWSVTDISTDDKSIKLTHPPTNTGIYKDYGLATSFGADHGAEAKHNYYDDVAVLAFPISPNIKVFSPDRVSSSSDIDSKKLQDGALSTGQKLYADKSGGDAWIIYHYDQPVEISQVTLAFEPIAMFLGAKAKVFLDLSEDGEHFVEQANLPMTTSPETTAAFGPRKIKAFKIRFIDSPSPFGLPSDMAPGVDASLPSPPKADKLTMNVFEINASNEVLVNRFQEKAGFAIASNYYDLDQGHEVQGVNIEDVIDLTNKLRADGTLDWSPKHGLWRVMRFGYSLIGTENHPAVPEATGLEVDKYDPDAVKAYINRYLDNYAEAIGADKLGEKGISNVLNDSIESGAANWTPNMLAAFEKYRGYSMLPWLPVLAGNVVETPAKSDAFLYDFRQTLADLIADNHYAVITDELHKRGIVHYSESLENGRPNLGNDLSMRKTADIPMAAMWTFDAKRSIGPRAQYWADVRGAASVAHVYGREHVAAESLTSAVSPWAFSPRDFQPMIDMEFALGVTRPVLHSSVHQPVDNNLPGMSLWIFGHYFNRHDTWAEHAKPWVDYLARNSYMLNQGRFVADVGYFTGEETPLTELYIDEPHLDVPRANGFDYLNADMLINALNAKDGRLISEGGASYRAVFLGGTSEYMTLPVLKKLQLLADSGITIIGKRPVSSPSLRDNDAEFQKIADTLWSSAYVGKTVFPTNDIKQGILDAGIDPDFEYQGEADSQVFFVHRSEGEKDIYFFTHRLNRQEQGTFRFNVTGRKPMLWDAETGNLSALSYRTEGNYTVIERNLRAFESGFIVFEEKTDQKAFEVKAPTIRQLLTMNDGWMVNFDKNKGLKDTQQMMPVGDWSLNDNPEIKYFSGSANYHRKLTIKASDLNNTQLILNLGEVLEMAEVSINGQPLRLLWKPPYAMDIKPWLKVGENTLDISITNLWVNRLIGDEQEGVNRKTVKPIATYRKDAPLRSSGLIGPVVLESAN